ncbi:ComEA family DNA-binding protein [Streptomyces sp. 796.1]|uniref:ComEA family DNA-binding protein n=1 Tax=Streptomyces sp. 796.1 TaxID=3163029 RepID=UPI0039C90E7C
MERLPLWVQARCAVQPKALGALAVVLLAAIALAGYHFWSGRPGSVEVPAERPRTAAGPATSTAPDRQPAPGPGPAPTASSTSTAGVSRWVVVDVAGRVRRPGVRRLPAGARVADALRAAGGAEPGVRMSELNRARILIDGEQIAVGIRAGAAAAAGSPAIAGLDGTVCKEEAGGAAGAGGGGAPGGAGPAATGAPVSLNTATAEQLEALPGVGPVLVQHILEYRAQHGGFRSVAELREVSGIGDKRFSDLRPLVQP